VIAEQHELTPEEAATARWSLQHHRGEVGVSEAEVELAILELSDLKLRGTLFDMFARGVIGVDLNADDELIWHILSDEAEDDLRRARASWRASA